MVIKISDDEVAYSIQDALCDVEACLACVETQGSRCAELTLVPSTGEYFREALHMSEASPDGIAACRAGRSPFTVLQDDTPMNVPCTGTYRDFSLAAGFPAVAAMQLLRPPPLTQEDANAALERELARMMSGRESDEESVVRSPYGHPIPEASRGLVLGGNPALDDPPVVLIAAGEVSWYCEEDELPSLQDALERLEAHLQTSSGPGGDGV